MPRGYSRDLRERVLRAAASGMPASEIQTRFGVSVSSQQRWKRKRTQALSLEPGTSPGGPRKIPVTDEAALHAQVVAAPDATLDEHCAQWAAMGHVGVSRATMCRALRRIDLPLKKRR